LDHRPVARAQLSMDARLGAADTDLLVAGLAEADEGVIRRAGTVAGGPRSH
jgi:hypothetical protein